MNHHRVGVQIQNPSPLEGHGMRVRLQHLGRNATGGADIPDIGLIGDITASFASDQILHDISPYLLNKVIEYTFTRQMTIRKVK